MGVPSMNDTVLLTVRGLVGGQRHVHTLHFRAVNALTTEELLIDGNKMAQRFTLTGTDSGGFMGVPPTGKPFRIAMMWLCELGETQIVHARFIYDFSGMLIQIGVLKAKPA